MNDLTASLLEKERIQNKKKVAFLCIFLVDENGTVRVEELFPSSSCLLCFIVSLFPPCVRFEWRIVGDSRAVACFYGCLLCASFYLYLVISYFIALYLV